MTNHLRIGLVGAGRMGREIGRHLLREGSRLTVHDVDIDAAAPLIAGGAAWAGSPAAVAADSDIVLVVVVDDQQVQEVVVGENGILQGAQQGCVVAVCASVSPTTCRVLASEASGRQVSLIDAALVGGERGAEAGELLVLCGGDPDAIRRLGEALSPTAKAVENVGGPGAGMTAKIVNNLMLWSCIRADYEALTLGRALGVEPANLRRALVQHGTGSNRPLADWGEHRLRWPGKDLEQALELAVDLGVDLPLISGLPDLVGRLTPSDLRDLL